MVASTSSLAYQDCYDVLDRALSRTVGVRVPVDDYDHGVHIRSRLYMARKINRQDNAASYPHDHRLFGRSVYDVLYCTIANDNGKFYVYVRKRAAGTMDIEDLGEEDEQFQPTPRDSQSPEGESAEAPAANAVDESAFEPRSEAASEATPVGDSTVRRRV